jgi:tetratricopeptide (TPR) repeat protein
VLQRAEQDAAAALGPADARTQRATLRRADVLRLQEKNDEARQLVEPLLPALRARAAALPEDLAVALWILGELSFKLGKPDGVGPYVREGLTHVQATLGAGHPERLRLLGLQVRSSRVQGRNADALAASEDALRLAQSLYAGVQRHPQLSETRYVHAFVLADNGRYREAVAAFRTAIAETEALFGRASRRYGTRLGAASEIFAEAGLLREAIAGAELARETLRAHVPPRSRLDIASAEAVALARHWARDSAGSLPHWQYAEAGYVALFGDTHWTVQLTRRNHSLALTWAGRLDDAERLMAGVLRQSARLARDGYDANAWIAGIRERLAGRPAAALALQQQALASLPADARDRTPRARILTELGLAQLALGNLAAARTALDEALRLFEARGVDLVAEHADALLGLGQLLLAEGAPGALVPIERAEAFWRDLRADSRWAGEAAHWRARALAASGRAAEAQPVRDRARAILARSPFPVDRPLVASAR